MGVRASFPVPFALISLETPTSKFSVTLLFNLPKSGKLRGFKSYFTLKVVDALSLPAVPRRGGGPTKRTIVRNDFKILARRGRQHALYRSRRTPAPASIPRETHLATRTPSQQFAGFETAFSLSVFRALELHVYLCAIENLFINGRRSARPHVRLRRG